ncbi:hypothetical protein QR674_12525 [Acinetobacter chinensis]|uniref:DNA-binding protein n=1 Tax=Acinetobacter chinensis TaxID=2004650 RepID=A0ABU3WHC2_9GAMM|nr:hypothetical protein [Acinetobacter chinensis]MDV2469805.1 hypothetical protein [Acinetobacter chinensis]
MSEEILNKLVAKITKLLDAKTLIPLEYQLWSEKEIAQYFKYSEDYTKKHIIKNPCFPPSRELPTSTDGKRTVHRWKASDVISYAMAFDKAAIRYK